MKTLLLLILTLPVIAGVYDGTLHPMEAYMVHSVLQNIGITCDVGIGIEASVSEYPWFVVMLPNQYLGYSDKYDLISNCTPSLLEKIGGIVGSVAGVTMDSGWTSSFLAIFFEDYIILITTEAAREAAMLSCVDDISGGMCMFEAMTITPNPR